MELHFVDKTAIITANALNLLFALIFYLRYRGYSRGEYAVGIITLILAVPLLFAGAFNYFLEREWWSYILLLPIILFLVIELFVDYINPSDFRNTRFVWGYLLVYYLGLWGLIGYSFLMLRMAGYITLGTYFINLIVTGIFYPRTKKTG